MAADTPSPLANPSSEPAQTQIEPWELETMRLVAEQAAIPFDQLARFLVASERQAAKIAKHLADAGVADYARILHGEPPLLWLTQRGCRLSGTGFSYLPPRVGALARIRAVNEVRLHIAARAPEARWICGRTVFRQQGYRGHRAHAVVESEGERHAILALLRPGRPEHWIPAFQSHIRRHDAVIAFCLPSAERAVQRLAKRHHWPKLVIRPLPGSAVASIPTRDGPAPGTLTRR